MYILELVKYDTNKLSHSVICNFIMISVIAPFTGYPQRAATDENIELDRAKERESSELLWGAPSGLLVHCFYAHSSNKY